MRLRCITGRVDCCTSANTKWCLPSGVAATSGIRSYGRNSIRGAIELVSGSPESLMQGIHRCTLPESDPATNPSTISLYVGIYIPGQGECIANLVSDLKWFIIIDHNFISEMDDTKPISCSVLCHPFLNEYITKWFFIIIHVHIIICTREKKKADSSLSHVP